MKYLYTIVTSPDPDNPEEQGAGTSIVDNRMWKHDALSVTKNGQTYTPDYFTKSFLSSTLSSTAFSFSVGEKVLVEYE